MSETQRKHFLTNYIVDQITAFLMEDRGISIEQALDIIYSSRLYDALLDEQTGLSSYSPSYIYELLKAEQDNSIFR